VMNAGFGELYTAGGSGELPGWETVLSNKGGYPRKPDFAPRGVLRVVAGVDVQKRSLIYTIRGFGARGTSWLLDHGYLYGETSEPEVWDDLSLLMTEPVSGLTIERVFIDSGFRPDKREAGDEHKVYEWANRYSYMAFPTKGRDTLGGRPYAVSKIEVRPDGKKLPWSIDLVHINTDFFKSLVHSRLKTPLDQPGAFFLHADADEDYARQLVSEARIMGPKLKPEWVKRQRDNHFLDCEALAAAAAYSLNVQAIPAGVERDYATGEPETAGEAREAAAAHGETPPVKSSIRDRFRKMGERSRR
jgi:phage terminase large subunit GpA-like protein